jgi:hypothetical protein
MESFILRKEQDLTGESREFLFAVGAAGIEEFGDVPVMVGARGDHIGDINEMILYPLAAVETRGAGGFDDGLEIPEIGVAENLGEVPAGPEFIARRIRPPNFLKGSDSVAHGFSFSSSGIRFQRRLVSKDRRWR